MKKCAGDSLRPAFAPAAGTGLGQMEMQWVQRERERERAPPSAKTTHFLEPRLSMDYLIDLIQAITKHWSNCELKEGWEGSITLFLGSKPPSSKTFLVLIISLNR